MVTTLKPAEVIEQVKDSGLRGRGGAGFPTGVKWSFLPTNIWPHYVVANADESEPGTFKDREILEINPYQFLEGLMIASYAVQANDAYIYLRGEFCADRPKFDERIAGIDCERAIWAINYLERDYSLHIAHASGRWSLYLRRRNRSA